MSKNYRRIYAEHIGRPVPTGWHIHHIDHDRANNSPSNLVALPPDVHLSYHFAWQVYESEFDQWGHLSISADEERFNMIAYYDGSFKEWYDGTDAEFIGACQWISSKAAMLLRVDSAKASACVAKAQIDLYIEDQRCGAFNLFNDKMA